MNQRVETDAEKRVDPDVHILRPQPLEPWEPNGGVQVRYGLLPMGGRLGTGADGGGTAVCFRGALARKRERLKPLRTNTKRVKCAKRTICALLKLF